MLLPPTIDIQNSQNYILSMRIHPSEFMFSLYKPGDGKNYCLRETKFEQSSESLLERIQKIVYELNYLTQQFAKTNVVFVTPDYHFVPSGMYDSKRRNELYTFSTEKEDTLVMANEISKYDVVSLASVEEDLYDFLKRSLYNPKFHVHSSQLVNLFGGAPNVVSVNAKMYVNVGDCMVDIICLRGKELLHASSHEGLSANEIVYYVLKTWESLGLNQLQDKLLMAGNVEESSQATFKEYIKNTGWVAAPSEVYLWHKDALRAPLDLIALSICE